MKTAGYKNKETKEGMWHEEELTTRREVYGQVKM
jgi:hypothetical protein